MNIIEAAEAVTLGKKVRRPWGDGWSYLENTEDCGLCTVVKGIPPLQIDFCDIFADDWEVEEKVEQ